MPEETQGTATQQATTAQSGQTAEQQPLQTEQTQTPETQPSLDQIRQELQQERESRIRSEQSAKYYQAEFTRSRQQAQALAGIVPQEDPYAKQAKFFESKGFDSDQGRVIAEFVTQALTPIQQENQQLRAAQQATGLVDQVLYNFQNQNPTLIADQATYQAVREQLAQVAQQGQANLITPEYVESLAVLERHYRSKGQPAPQQVQRQQPQQVSPFGFNGPSGNFQAMPQRQAGPQVDAAADAYIKSLIPGYGKSQTK